MAGHLRRGMNYFDPEKNTFKHYRRQWSNQLSSDNVFALMEDHKGNLWMGYKHRWGKCTRSGERKNYPLQFK
jgi:ligand-binding sensor domain-containing protein